MHRLESMAEMSPYAQQWLSKLKGYQTRMQAPGPWPALAAPNMHSMNHFAGSSSSPQPGSSMVPPTVPSNGGLPGEAPPYEGQLVSRIMQAWPLHESKTTFYPFSTW